LNYNPVPEVRVLIPQSCAQARDAPSCQEGNDPKLSYH